MYPSEHENTPKREIDGDLSRLKVYGYWTGVRGSRRNDGKARALLLCALTVFILTLDA
jgi:hypothetical protein